MDELLKKLWDIRTKQKLLQRLVRNTPLGEKRSEYLESLNQTEVELKNIKKQIAILKIEQRKGGKGNERKSID